MRSLFFTLIFVVGCSSTPASSVPDGASDLASALADLPPSSDASTCKDTRDCAVGEVCDTKHACVAGATACAADAECGRGFACLDKQCTMTKVCMATSDCSDCAGTRWDGGFICSSNGCDGQSVCFGNPVCDLRGTCAPKL